MINIPRQQLAQHACNHPNTSSLEDGQTSAVEHRARTKWTVEMNFAALRKVKASYFDRMFGEVKKSSAYWKLIDKATSRIAHKKINWPSQKKRWQFGFDR